ncbi:WG repeat-containing protein [Paenibacillus mesophilus]
MDKKGNWVILPAFDYAESFENGVARVTVGKDDDAVEFYIDATGRSIGGR